jgi:hypothetical protein
MVWIAHDTTEPDKEVIILFNKQGCGKASVVHVT